MKGIILAFCITTLYFCFVAGLKCYQCEYNGGEKPNNPGCNAKNISGEFLKPCDAPKTHCMTVIGSKNVSNAVVPAVERGCAVADQNKTMGCNRTEYKGFEKTPMPEVCICASEGCNTEMHNNTAPAIGLSYFSLPLLGVAFGQML